MINCDDCIYLNAMKEQVLEELRQCEGAREFVPGEKNWHILFSHCGECLLSEYTYDMEILGVDIYFPTDNLAQKAIETVGEDRLKRYLFGVKSPLDKLIDKASKIVGKPMVLDKDNYLEFVLTDEDGYGYITLHGDFSFSFSTLWAAFHKLLPLKRKQLIEAVMEYYEAIENDL